MSDLKEDFERLEKSLLIVIRERYPNLKTWNIFDRHIVCPTVAAHAILDEIENAIRISTTDSLQKT